VLTSHHRKKMALGGMYALCNLVAVNQCMWTLVMSLLQGGVMQSPFGAPAPQPTVGSLTHSHSHSGLPPTVGNIPLPCGGG
jgi:hypothetical protein